ncbi:urea transport system ATP-binding protein [Aminobacter lissarensis]|uniref:Urea transport system ATP-binding protein n=1 Tax=Aminobacter carboxidus TaxID=376165 RepID=A0A8E1WHB7_9HYPH|nr:urea ABC transporter ATP-binding subunit UrtE [Aminobacter lissarensis]MBB6467998.1 urea transport system ATP-binding protein [Aminobacter lissarensis]
MLNLSNVTSYYGKTPILHNVGFEVAQGECLCVLGRNGVGKTTLMQTIMGLTSRMSGRLMLGKIDVSEFGTAARALLGLGYVPQGRRIFGKFTVRENILLGTFARQDGSRELPELCLQMFPYLADNLDKQAGFLSGGQQQQLAIARALATDPKVLLLDEPTEGIQPNVVADIHSALVRLNRELGITIILTEQHIKIAKSMSDKYIIMDTGKIVDSGSSDNLTQEVVNKHLSI